MTGLRVVPPPRVFAARVFGHPAPKGSKRHVGGGRMIESSKRLPGWAQALNEQLAVAAAGFDPFPRWAPVRVDWQAAKKRRARVNQMF